MSDREITWYAVLITAAIILALGWALVIQERDGWRTLWCIERLAQTHTVTERMNLYREVPQCRKLRGPDA